VAEADDDEGCQARLSVTMSVPSLRLCVIGGNGFVGVLDRSSSASLVTDDVAQARPSVAPL
jgi:hypothetical protein